MVKSASGFFKELTLINSSTSYDNYGSYISASNALQNLFGDFVFTGSNSSSKAPWIKEFGPVAREIKKISTKYSTRPGLVKYPQIILNPNVTLIGYNANSFGIEAYILNNTGAFVDIADGGEKSFIVVGELTNNPRISLPRVPEFCALITKFFLYSYFFYHFFVR